jgi:hypothetical protein
MQKVKNPSIIFNSLNSLEIETERLMKSDSFQSQP